MEFDDHTGGSGEARTPEPGSAVERSYRMLQDMLLSFRIKPGERINESEISKTFGVSRTPLREALNRLASENFVDFVPAKGFFSKTIRPKEMHELLELRIALEVAGVKLAVQQATDAEIDALYEYVRNMRNIAYWSPSNIVAFDERFHEALIGMSRNSEILNALRAVNIRIRALRYLGIDSDRLEVGEREQHEICLALKARDTSRLTELVTAHIYRSLPDVEQAVRELYGRIYAPRA